MRETSVTINDTADGETPTKSDAGLNEIPDNFLYTFIPLNLMVGLTVIILNSLVGNFYRKGKRSTAAMLYIYLTGWDITMGATAIIHAIYMIIHLELDVDENEAAYRGMLSGVYVVTNVALRSSVFANTVLSTVRTINISQPFYRVRRKSLHVVYWTCVLFLLILCAVDIWQNLYHDELPIQIFEMEMFLNPALGYKLLEQALGIDTEESKKGIDFFVGSSVSNSFFHLSTIIALICLGIQCKVLLGNSEMKNVRRKTISRREVSPPEQVSPAFPADANPAGAEKRVEESRKRSSEVRTTITIIQLTTVFCLCNSAYSASVVWLVYDTTATENTRPDGLTMFDRQMFYITSTFVPFLNCLINPLILTFRSNGVREFVKSVFNRTSD